MSLYADTPSFFWQDPMSVSQCTGNQMLKFINDSFSPELSQKACHFLIIFRRNKGIFSFGINYDHP